MRQRIGPRNPSRLMVWMGENYARLSHEFAEAERIAGYPRPGWRKVTEQACKARALDREGRLPNTWSVAHAFYRTGKRRAAEDRMGNPAQANPKGEGRM